MNENNNIFEDFANSENYMETIENTSEEICNQFRFILLNYIEFILENIKIQKDKNVELLRFIILRGLDIINNVFDIILLHTKNAKMALFHCQKSFYYYVEYIEQTFNCDTSYLQLTSRDAMMYVYKKTIYSLKYDLKKENNTDEDLEEKIIRINHKNNLVKMYIWKLIQNSSFINVKKEIYKINKAYENINRIQDLERILILTKITDDMFNKTNNLDTFLDNSILISFRVLQMKNNDISETQMKQLYELY